MSPIRKRCKKPSPGLRWYLKPDDPEKRVQAANYAEALQIFAIIENQTGQGKP